MATTPRVSIRKCARYEDGVQQTVDRLLDDLGATDLPLGPGKTVLIKPNLLTARRPEEAVTTHPEVVRAIIRAVRRAGSEPRVGDSPADVTRLEKVWDETGYAAMCREEKVELLNLERSGSAAFDIGGARFSVARPVLDADVVINAPKVKTHVLTVLTCAVKNLYGCIPGFQKGCLHKQHPTPSDFGRLLVALHPIVKPAITIADGIVGMQGNGPSAGQPVALRFLAASNDAVALDTAICRILGIRPRSVPYLRNRGRAPGEQVELLGDPVDELKPDSFRLPATWVGTLIPGRLIRGLRRFLWVRPSISGSDCIRCGACVQACPVEALSMQTGQLPVLSPHDCIGCCCCHEVCPGKAIDMTTSPLFKVLARGGMP